MIIGLDQGLVEIILLSLRVSGTALVIASAVAVPTGALLALSRFRGRSILIGVFNTLMSLPPVTVGLFVYLLLSRSGPLGFMGLLYSPSAMIAAQSILAFPIVAALSMAAIEAVPSTIRMAALTLGATRWQASLCVMREARLGIASAMLAGFGRLIAEVGAILIVGGNIAGYTRVMTTTIALETDKGNFELAIALGIVLLTVSLIINMSIGLLGRRYA